MQHFQASSDSSPGSSAAEKQMSFSMLHMLVVKYKKKLLEGMAVAVEAEGGRRQARDATRKVMSSRTPTLYRLQSSECKSIHELEYHHRNSEMMNVL